jgi:hypothetical protein
MYKIRAKLKRIIIIAYFGGTLQLVEQQTAGLSLLLVQGVDDIDVRRRQCFEMWICDICDI